MKSENPGTVTIETTSANHVDEDSEIKFKLTLRQSKDIQIEEDTEDTTEQTPYIEIDQAIEVPQEEPVVTPVEVKIDHGVNEKVEAIDDTEEKEFESVEAPQDEPIEEQKETQDENVETQASANVGEGISLEFKIEGGVNLNIDAEDKSQDQPKLDSEVKETEHVVEAPVTDAADGGHVLKDKRSTSNALTGSNEDKPSKAGSKWPPSGDEKKKPGRVNQVDFRNNLKKSGKIAQGKGVLNLEKKHNTTGAQVDFRSGNLKKSGRIGGGTVNLESKISTQGAQVDFRGSSLKSSGKIGGGGIVHLERKTNTAGAQVDFRSALKKGASPADKSGVDRKGSVKSETPPRKDSQPSEEAVEPPAKTEPLEKEAETSEVEEKPDTPVEDNLSKEEPPAPVKVTVPAPVEKKPPAKEPKPVRVKNEKSSVPDKPETVRNQVKSTRNESKTAQKEPEPVQNGPASKEEDIGKDNDEEVPAQVDIKLDVNIDNAEASQAPSVNHKEPSPAPSVNNKASPAPKEKDVPGTKGKIEFKYKPRDSYKTKEEASKNAPGGKGKLFDKLSKFQAKDETSVKPKGYTPSPR